MKAKVLPFNNVDVMWVTIEFEDEESYKDFHTKINEYDIEHICNSLTNTVYVNAVDYIKFSLDARNLFFILGTEIKQ